MHIQQLIANKKVSTFRRALFDSAFGGGAFRCDLNTVQRTGSHRGIDNWDEPRTTGPSVSIKTRRYNYFRGGDKIETY